MNNQSIKKRHVNIPIFIPHEGCPNNCVFCNQHTITQTEDGGSKRDIVPEIEACLATLDSEMCECEIAFFGGSFTGIPREDMIRLLETAYGYIKSGKVASIRLSTRPDYIDEEILDILERYGVRHIELGIQSMDDKVLTLSGRGHTAETTEKACRLITERGFSLTGQMMTGLPGATPESEVMTAKRICDMGAESARIYPTVVFRGTQLCNMSQSGEYTPLTNEEAAERSAKVYKVFADNGVKLLRIGLQSGEGLSDDNVYAGASHSAIGEMTVARYYLDIMLHECEKIAENMKSSEDPGTVLTVFCAEGETSKVSGQKRVNKQRITEFFREKGMRIREIKIKESKDIPKNKVKIITETIKKRGE
ncbi:MAG: radical SAM protein [Ruminococcaceae bacterium]|nr:radical SAM protein [Oscillospiraceae bacterium]